MSPEPSLAHLPLPTSVLLWPSGSSLPPLHWTLGLPLEPCCSGFSWVCSVNYEHTQLVPQARILKPEFHFMAQRLSSPLQNFFRADYTFFPPTHFPIQLSFFPIASPKLLPQVSCVSIYPNGHPVLNSDYSLWELPSSFCCNSLVATCFKFQPREEVLSDSLSWARCSQNRPPMYNFSTTTHTEADRAQSQYSTAIGC